jgi:hypothetical protein
MNLYLKTATEADMIEALPFLICTDLSGGWQWKRASHDFAFDPMGDQVITHGTYDESGNEVTPPVMAGEFYALLKVMNPDFYQTHKTLIDAITITKPAWMKREFNRSGEPPVTPEMIKIEARSRILEKYPEWKQANMTARMVELNKIRASVGSWTAGEQIEVDVIQSAWDWVKSVRSASDALELTLPVDYNNNNLYWPKS